MMNWENKILFKSLLLWLSSFLFMVWIESKFIIENDITSIIIILLTVLTSFRLVQVYIDYKVEQQVDEDLKKLDNLIKEIKERSK